jgi:hypothetical protein
MHFCTHLHYISTKKIFFSLHQSSRRILYFCHRVKVCSALDHQGGGGGSTLSFCISLGGNGHLSRNGCQLKSWTACTQSIIFPAILIHFLSLYFPGKQPFSHGKTFKPSLILTSLTGQVCRPSLSAKSVGQVCRPSLLAMLEASAQFICSNSNVYLCIALQCLFSHSFTTYEWLNRDCDVQMYIGITSRWTGYKSPQNMRHKTPLNGPQNAPQNGPHNNSVG